MADISLTELQELCPLFEDSYYEVVDLDRVVQAKISSGGTSPASVMEQFAVATKVLSSVEAAQA